MSALPEITASVPLAPFCTLRAGGSAEYFARAQSADELAELAIVAFDRGWPVTILGGGSNTLPADEGVSGLVVLNQNRELSISPSSGEVYAGTGLPFQELFLKTAQAGLGGLEYAVGIPGSLGGALASNAGAYRSNLSEHLTQLEVVHEGVRRWESPEFLRFSYRDSRLRERPSPQITVLRIQMMLKPREAKAIYDEARDYQRQRISKQPPPASAGSFFKNVNDHALAQTISNLPARLREAGVIPAGFLLEHAGMAGFRVGGAMLAPRHANFVLNAQRASATDIRNLARAAIAAVQEKFGVTLEEEVLYLGNWPTL